MFSELFESVARPTTKRKRWAVVISGTLQIACLLILLIVPLIYTEALPEKIFKTTWVGPPAAARGPKHKHLRKELAPALSAG